MNQDLERRIHETLSDQDLHVLFPGVDRLIMDLANQVRGMEDAANVYRADWEWAVEPDVLGSVVLVIRCYRWQHAYLSVPLRTSMFGNQSWADMANVVAYADQQFARFLLSESRRATR